MERRDIFDISGGNLNVLQIIPEMMTKPEWRNQLRYLVLNYLQQKTLKEKK